jgi:hypothetical protein
VLALMPEVRERTARIAGQTKIVAACGLFIRTAAKLRLVWLARQPSDRSRVNPHVTEMGRRTRGPWNNEHAKRAQLMPRKPLGGRHSFG